LPLVDQNSDYSTLYDTGLCHTVTETVQETSLNIFPFLNNFLRCIRRRSCPSVP